MMLILLRTCGPLLSIEVDKGRLAWIARLTDPLISRVRNVLPHMGPIDFGPIGALVLVWFVRILSTRILEEMALAKMNAGNALGEILTHMAFVVPPTM